ncbi:thioredoxin-disulfide reductase [Leucobacter sp. UCMA 4100]|uniref:thioredoxin-disulfide reductase n=1 Tax=Leucobacter sp. UCMA 4100 TaxID=2810534 RepID=UPI0022EAFDCB|nr:thioredoxin-disulfide reductase [Leucobacter sp. UCMA 4100]MDA3147045.1 thioredoxin-disulfide reductase [Leucobacter sp. UCMA 4100]
MHQMIIIGSGPAGYTAAIYAARAGLEPVMFASSVAPGGELMNTTEVENFPGFPEGIQGPDLMQKMQEQAEKFGMKLVFDDVTAVDLAGEVKKVTTSDGTVHEAKTVILSTGSAYRKLGLENEEALTGHGISSCATCDGFFFRDREIAVVGGGDSAMEEAIFLTRFASKVTIIHRREEFRASKIMADRALQHEKIEVLWNTEVHEIHGEGQLTGVTLNNTVNGEKSELAIDGLFVAIGNDPRVSLVEGQLDLTADGTIAVEGRSSRTSLPGVFAAGDVIDPTYRQAITAAASGTAAALDAEHYLSALDN